MPHNFIRLYDNERLDRLVGYMQAIDLRAQRGLLNLEKDRIKAERMLLYEKRLEAMLHDLESGGSLQRRQAIETYFWMLEEYRISVFAPEIRTGQPVSSKKLEAQIEFIESIE